MSCRITTSQPLGDTTANGYCIIPDIGIYLALGDLLFVILFESSADLG